MATPLLELRNVTKVFQSGIRKSAANTTDRAARCFADRPERVPDLDRGGG